MSFPKYRSDVCDPVGDGVEDLARMELERGECLSPVCNKETREGLSQCIGDCLEWLDLQNMCGAGKDPELQIGVSGVPSRNCLS